MGDRKTTHFKPREGAQDCLLGAVQGMSFVASTNTEMLVVLPPVRSGPTWERGLTGYVLWLATTTTPVNCPMRKQAANKNEIAPKNSVRGIAPVG